MVLQHDCVIASEFLLLVKLEDLQELLKLFSFKILFFFFSPLRLALSGCLSLVLQMVLATILVQHVWKSWEVELGKQVGSVSFE